MSGALAKQIEYRRAAGGPFVAAWFPLLRRLREALPSWVAAAAADGADLVAVEVPSTDGLYFDRAGERICRAAGDALEPSAALEVVAACRDEVEAPIALFTHLDPVLSAGPRGFAEQAASSGIDAIVCLDLPLDEPSGIASALRDAGLSLLRGVSFETERKRISRIDTDSDGVLWCQDPVDPGAAEWKGQRRLLKRLSRHADGVVLADLPTLPESKALKALEGILLRRAGVLGMDSTLPIGESVRAQLAEIRGATG